jgi:type I restriction enzyme R subunit
MELDEADTRKLIDQQLSASGWTVNSAQLSYTKGARPQKGRNLAIAEWPGASGPADYLLFVGLTPIAVIEAKRKNIDVSGALQQAKRYSRGFAVEPEHEVPGGPWDEYKIPFVFSANGGRRIGHR